MGIVFGIYSMNIKYYNKTKATKECNFLKTFNYTFKKKYLKYSSRVIIFIFKYLISLKY